MESSGVPDAALKHGTGTVRAVCTLPLSSTHVHPEPWTRPFNPEPRTLGSQTLHPDPGPSTLDPQVRAHVETQINLIAKGQADKAAVVSWTLDAFRQKFLFFVTKVARMDALFEASFSPLSASGACACYCRPALRYCLLLPACSPLLPATAGLLSAAACYSQSALRYCLLLPPALRCCLLLPACFLLLPATDQLPACCSSSHFTHWLPTPSTPRPFHPSALQLLHSSTPLQHLTPAFSHTAIVHFSHGWGSLGLQGTSLVTLQ